MPRTGIKHKIFSHIGSSIAQGFCILLIIFQGATLDYYMINHYNNWPWYLFIICDVLALAVFITAFVLAHIYRKKIKHGVTDLPAIISGSKLGLLPFAYIAWFIYAVFLVPRVAIIFKHIAAGLDEDDFFGPNTLKTAVASTGVIFLLLLLSQHAANKNIQLAQKHYIAQLTAVIPFDLMDSVEFMEILFVNESRIVLPFIFEDFIIAFPCINLLLPGMVFMVLSHSGYGLKQLSKATHIVYTLCHILLVDLPYLCIRMYLWHTLNLDISVFLIKNIMMIFLELSDIGEACESKKPESSEGVDNTDDGANETIELRGLDSEHPTTDDKL